MKHRDTWLTADDLSELWWQPEMAVCTVEKIIPINKFCKPRCARNKVHNLLNKCLAIYLTLGITKNIKWIHSYTYTIIIDYFWLLFEKPANINIPHDTQQKELDRLSVVQKRTGFVCNWFFGNNHFEDYLHPDNYNR